METGIHLSHAAGHVQMSGCLAQRDEVRISCYDNEVPAFAGPEIDRLYGHLCCSLSFFEMAKQIDGASTYAVRKGGKLITILLYTRTENDVTVISEFARIDEEEIRRFADYMFSRFDSVKVVSFRKLQADIHALGYPWHAAVCSEDMIVTLPPTVKEYEAAVGKNMRRNIKRYTNALVKNFPSYRYRVCLKDEISEQDIRDIVALSCRRMKSKNIVARFTEEETQWIVDFSKKCGIAGVATIDGEVCAGAIGFRIGENFFMYVIAHDLKYNDYSLGILCYYHTICEGIARGGKRFHLLQGRYGYKYRLLADRQDIVELDIYRSRVHALACGRKIFKKEVAGRIRQAKQWLLHDAERHDGAPYRLLGRIVNTLRTAKRLRGS
jgi:hypothetical protein